MASDAGPQLAPWNRAPSFWVRNGTSRAKFPTARLMGALVAAVRSASEPRLLVALGPGAAAVAGAICVPACCAGGRDAETFGSPKTADDSIDIAPSATGSRKSRRTDPPE